MRPELSTKPGVVRDVIVVGPRMDSQGGIAQVTSTYAAAGLFNGPSHGFRVRHFPSTVDGSSARKLAYGLRRVLRFAFESVPPGSIVHLHTTWRGSIWRKAAYAWLARRRRALVIHHLHAFGLLDTLAGSGGVSRWLIRSTLTRADALIVLTPAMADRARAAFPGVPVHVVPNPVEPFPPESSKTARDPALVAYLGWFIPEKGVFDLLDALVLLHRRGCDVRVALAGSHNRDGLRAGIVARGLEESAVDGGWLDRSEVASLLRRCAVLAHPSHQEGFGLVLVEAMACGTPIVTCPVGGVPDVLIEGRNAVFVPPGRPDRLADALEAILADEEMRAAMGRAGPSDARRFEPAGVIDTLRRTYAACLPGGRKAAS